MLLASGYSADCTELWMMLGELIDTWVFSCGILLGELIDTWVFRCGYSWVSSLILTPEYSAVGYSRVSSLTPEYWATDTLRWAHWELSIQLWTLSGELMKSWILSYGHSPVSSWRVEYSTMDTLGWAHGELSIQLRTLSGELMRTWVFNCGHSPVGSWAPEYSTTDTLGWTWSD